ncbi:nucleotidyl transferase [Fadolivirus algeromassiliense]|jgi:capsule biosynthesis phosphatase|uniref:Nucleotidyl transferase n=1 Tax=Fadolivirus FV1/VV64 TaxID=3070911 RepID=A0A7D3V5I3_9VIRU|nr:nucleotidyl transferase [Fadolivirus algeromassiliense]QKF93892.1 nucleotidyl transferase [Fadolivirus FV1/VV64]
MNIIIPLGGLGERFKKENYINPKPLIKILGKEMIMYVIKNLNLQSDDIVHIIYNPELEQYGFIDLINKSNIKTNLIKLNKQTEGASETILYGLSTFNDNLLNRKCVLMDGDTFYTKDILSIYRNQIDNAVFAFHDDQDKPIFSYIKFDQNNIIKEIKEKNKISEYANTGCYCFKNGYLLKEYCEKVILKNIRQNGEYYTSCVIDLMIKDNLIFIANIINKTDFHCIGTPLQLKLFCINNIKNGEKLKICFDLDGTLVTTPTVPNDYKTVSPIHKNIEFLKFLKNIGHYIIIHTARRMKTHNSNVGKVLKDIGKLTFDTLDDFNIPYDEIYFGKPNADIYIDDKALNAYHDLEKETGIYFNKISERSFNQITMTSMDIVIKRGDMNKLYGEIYWYKNIPKEIKDLFPTFIKEEKDGYIIEKINGITLSFIYIKESLSTDIFKNFLTTITKLHNLPVNDTEINIYDNYTKKIQERYKTYNYNKFNNSEKIYNDLIMFFENYEKNNLGKIGIIHGDPVFTNVILTKELGFKFIDMRGKMGDKYTIYGDIFYDYAKIYQSLLGYDEILLDKYVQLPYKTQLLTIFENHIVSIYGKETLENIKMITASLLFTLIPLHNNDKCDKYFELIKIK